jgi:diguanylate cyclase (GGDEF)-like protein
MPDKVLLIDDCSAIHGLVRARLRDEPVELHSAFDGNAGLQTAVTLGPDLILLDVEMPAPNGFEVCRRLKDDPRTMQVPVIFLTGAASTEEKIRGLELGAVDYVTKPFDPAELRARVRASLRTKYLMDLLARKAMIDGLTGLFNRAYFDARLISEMSLARRTQTLLSCIMVDVDRFKQINDEYGHPFGDEILRGIAYVLSENCRAEDSICRYGGEEFVVLCPNADSITTARLGERLRDCIEQAHFTRDGISVQVTCSFGVADLRGTPPPSIVELADKALYRAKQAGRNRVEVAWDDSAAPVKLALAV